MKKRILSILLCLVLCISLLPQAVLAAPAAEEPDVIAAVPVEPAEEPEAAAPAADPQDYHQIRNVHIYGYNTQVIGKTPAETFDFDSLRVNFGEQSVTVGAWNAFRVHNGTRQPQGKDEPYGAEDQYGVSLDLYPWSSEYSFTDDCVFDFLGKASVDETAFETLENGGIRVYSAAEYASETAPELHSVTVYGCGSMYAGEKAGAAFRFYDYDDEHAAQGFRVGYWYVEEGDMRHQVFSSESYYNYGTDMEFELGEDYSVRVVLFPTYGHTFAEGCKVSFAETPSSEPEEARSFYVTGSSTGSGIALGEQHAALKPIHSFDIAGFRAIYTYDTPNGTFDFEDEDAAIMNERYGVTLNGWNVYRVNGESRTEIAKTAQFTAGAQYSVCVEYALKEGYTFADDCTFSFFGIVGVADTEIRDGVLYAYTEPVTAVTPTEISQAVIYGCDRPQGGALVTDTYRVFDYAGDHEAQGFAVEQLCVSGSDGFLYMRNLSDSNTVFYAGGSYHALVFLAPLPGYVFSENCRFYFADGNTTRSAKSSSSVTKDGKYAAVVSPSDAAPATEITRVTIRGCNTLYVGNTPANTIHIDDFAEEFAAQGVKATAWDVGDRIRPLSDNEAFLGAPDAYELTVNLEPLTGFVFAENCTFAFDGGFQFRNSFSYSEKGIAVVSTQMTAQTPSEIFCVNVPGCSRVVAGKTPIETFAFDEYAQELACQHVKVTNWYCMDSSASYGKHVPFTADSNYFGLCVELEPLNGWTFAEDCEFSLGSELEICGVDFLESSRVRIYSEDVYAVEPETVTSVTIPGFGVVNVGKTPYETFRFDEKEEELAAQGVKTVAWSAYAADTGIPLDPYYETFLAGKSYYVCVELAPLSGNTISPDCFFAFDGTGKVNYTQTQVTDNGNAVVYSYPKAAKQPKVITHVSLPGYSDFVVGKTPAELFTFDAREDDFAAQGVSLVRWNPMNEICGIENDCVIDGTHIYSIMFTVEPTDGYIFSDNCTFAFEGWPDVEITVFSKSLRGGFLLMSDEVDPVMPEEIPYVRIFGVGTPQAGRSPYDTYQISGYRDTYAKQKVSVAETKYYNDTVEEYIGADAIFHAGEEYSLYLELKPAAGYTFSEDVAAELVGGGPLDTYWLTPAGNLAIWTCIEEAAPFEGETVEQIRIPGKRVMVAEYTPVGIYNYDRYWADFYAQGVSLQNWYVETASGTAVDPDEELDEQGEYRLVLEFEPLEGLTIAPECYVEFLSGDDYDDEKTVIEEDYAKIVSYPESPCRSVKNVSFSMTAPVAGTKVSDYSGLTPRTSTFWHCSYSSYITWFRSDEKATGQYFEDGVEYYARVYVWPNSGYVFDDRVTVAINGGDDLLLNYTRGQYELAIYTEDLTAQTAGCGVWIGDWEFTSDQTRISDGEGGEAVYDYTTQTLTLYGITVNTGAEHDGLIAGIYSSHGLNIVSDSRSISDNTVAVPGNSSKATYGIYVNGDLTVTGTRDLTVTCGSSTSGGITGPAALYAAGSIKLNAEADLSFGAYAVRDCAPYGVRAGNGKILTVAGTRVAGSVYAQGMTAAFGSYPSRSGYTDYCSTGIGDTPAKQQLTTSNYTTMRQVRLVKTEITHISVDSFGAIVAGEHIYDAYLGDVYHDYLDRQHVSVYDWSIYEVGGGAIGENDPFLEEKQYYLSMVLYPEEGYTISKKCTFDFAGEVEVSADSCVETDEDRVNYAVICSVPETPLIKLETVDIIWGNPEPGNRISGFGSMAAPEGAHWHFNENAPIAWALAEGGELGEYFEENTEYVAWLRIEPDEGYLIADDAAITFNGSADLYDYRSGVGTYRHNSLWVFTVPIVPEVFEPTLIESVDFLWNTPEAGSSIEDFNGCAAPEGVHWRIVEGLPLAWSFVGSGPDSGYFEPGNDYMTRIVIEADFGYAFADDVTVTFNGSGELFDYRSHMGSVMMIYTAPIYFPDDSVIPGYGVWVNGTEFTEEDTEIRAGTGEAVYDPDTMTLTLYGVDIDTAATLTRSSRSDIKAGILSLHDLKIESRSNSISNNTVTIPGSGDLADEIYGIYVMGDLTITGNKALTVCSGAGAGSCALRADGSITLAADADLSFGGISEEDCASVGIQSGVNLQAAKAITICGTKTESAVYAQGTQNALYPFPSYYDYSASFSETLCGALTEGELTSPEFLSYRQIRFCRTVIEHIEVDCFEAMVVGKTPADSFKGDTFHSYLDQQHVEIASWSIERIGSPAAVSTFEAGVQYRLRLVLVGKDGYTISEACTFEFTDGAAVDETNSGVSEGQDGRLYATVFSVPETPFAPINAVNILWENPKVGDTVADFNGMAAPAGAHWHFSAYPIMWSQHEEGEIGTYFEEETEYTAWLRIEADEGYLITEDAAITFNGSTDLFKSKEMIGTTRAPGLWVYTVPIIPGQPIVTDYVLPAFTVSHSCTLNECLELNYYIPVSELDGYDNIKMTVQYERFDGDTRTLSEEKTLTPTTVRMSGALSGAQRYRFSFKGIAAAEIGSRIYATVSAEKDGVTYYAAEPDEYSIADYCYAVLDTGMADSLKTLCVDTLNYGAAAQTHFNVNPGNLCNAKLTSAQKARSVGNVTLEACNSRAAYSGTVKASFGGKSYVLNNAPELKLRIVPNSGVDASKLTVKYTYTRADKSVATGTLTPEKDGSDWVVRLNTVAGPDLRSPITFIIRQGNTQVSDTLTFSAEGYSYAMINSATAKQTLKDLCRAMMNFSEAARRHFG